MEDFTNNILRALSNINEALENQARAAHNDQPEGANNNSRTTFDTDLDTIFDSGYTSSGSRSSSVSETTVVKTEISAVTNSRPVSRYRGMDEDEEEQMSIRTGRSNFRPPPPPVPANNNGGGAFTGALAIAGIGLAGYFLGKALFASKVQESFAATSSEVSDLAKEIEKDTQEYPVIGMDCQWTFNETRQPVALLQLASHKGKVLLIPMKLLSSFPTELRSLLGNSAIIKTGVKVFDDARHLREDYGIFVNSTFELWKLAEDCGHRPESLRKMAKKFLNTDLGDDREVSYSNWDNNPLTQKQKDYAEGAVKASIDIFQQLIQYVVDTPNKQNILNYCRPHLNEPY